MSLQPAELWGFKANSGFLGGVGTLLGSGYSRERRHLLPFSAVPAAPRDEGGGEAVTPPYSSPGEAQLHSHGSIPVTRAAGLSPPGPAPR